MSILVPLQSEYQKLELKHSAIRKVSQYAFILEHIENRPFHISYPSFSYLGIRKARLLGYLDRFRQFPG